MIGPFGVVFAAADRWRTYPKLMRALLTGLTGQDGYYLAAHLLAGGDQVIAGVKESELALAEKIARELGPIQILPCELEDPRSVEALVAQGQPEVVYHLAALSSTGLSWREPVVTAQINTMGTIYLLEALRRHAATAGFVLAGSCDCYDHEAAGASGVTPQTPFKATNPYAISKVMAQQMTQCYRQEYGLRASVAILFNHTSPRRTETFVERGIVRQAVRVSLGQAEAVQVGSLETRRDWSWAPELMEAFAAIGKAGEPGEFILASGQTMAVGDWVHEAFGQLGLDIEQQVRVDPSRLHPDNRQHTFGNIEATRQHLGWSPQVGLAEMVRRLIEFDLADLKAEQPGVQSKLD